MSREDYVKDCPFCGERFEAQRLNQKFCSKSCKTRYNNGKAKSQNEARQKIVGQIHDILWKNRELLRLNVDKEIAKAEMERVGFKWTYITNYKTAKNRNNQHVYFCYDYAYKFIDSDTIQIFKP